MLQVKQHLAVTIANKCTAEFSCFFKYFRRSVTSFTRSVASMGIYNPTDTFSALNGTVARLNNLNLPGLVFVNFCTRLRLTNDKLLIRMSINMSRFVPFYEPTICFIIYYYRIIFCVFEGCNWEKCSGMVWNCCRLYVIWN